MSNHSKQRIVGALVMIVVLAVFLFFLLHQNVPAPAPLVPQKISTFSFDLPQHVPPVAPTQTTPPPAVTPSVNNPVTTIPSTVPAPNPTPKPAPVALPEKPVVPIPAALPVAVPSASAVSVPAQPLPATSKPALATPQSVLQMMTAPDAWVLQVGTFGSSNRANRLVVQLRAAGLDVYTRFVADNPHRVSVFVGPKIHRADIESIRDQLSREFHLHGVIRKYQL